MKVFLAPPLFSDEQVDAGDLIEVISHGFDGRHDILATTPTDRDPIGSWLAQQGQSVQTKCRLALDESAVRTATQPSLSTIRIDVGTEDNWGSVPVLSLSTAKLLLRRAFRIWLENDVNDRNFLLAVAKKEVRRRLLDALQQQWISFENAGGIGSIPQRAREYGASPPDRLRCYLLFDSDVRLPGRPSRQASEAAVQCENGQLSYHRLERRAIENYIPMPALHRWAYASRPGRDARGRAARVRALSNMTPDQRNHFNLRYGFDGDEDCQEWPRAEVETLYAGLSADDRSWLQNGLGRQIGSEVYASAANAPFPYQWIVSEGISAELESVLETILKKL